MVKIISISLTETEKKFLDDMELSPTGLFKQKLKEVMENSYNYQNKLEVREAAILRLNKIIQEYAEKYGVLE